MRKRAKKIMIKEIEKYRGKHDCVITIGSYPRYWRVDLVYKQDMYSDKFIRFTHPTLTGAVSELLEYVPESVV